MGRERVDPCRAPTFEADGATSLQPWQEMLHAIIGLIQLILTCLVCGCIDT